MKNISSLLLLLLLVGFTGYSAAAADTQVPPKDADLSQNKMPAPRYKLQPVYPFGLFRADISGEAKIEFTVDTDGNVRDVRILQATQREFGLSSAEAILRWKFKPGVRDGKPASVRMLQAFVFADNKVQIAPIVLANTDEKVQEKHQP